MQAWMEELSAPAASRPPLKPSTTIRNTSRSPSPRDAGIAAPLKRRVDRRERLSPTRDILRDDAISARYSSRPRRTRRIGRDHWGDALCSMTGPRRPTIVLITASGSRPGTGGLGLIRNCRETCCQGVLRWGYRLAGGVLPDRKCCCRRDDTSFRAAGRDGDDPRPSPEDGAPRRTGPSP